MGKFVPYNPSKSGKKIVFPISLGVDDAEELANIAKIARISRTELVRQMVRFCLNEIDAIKKTNVITREDRRDISN